MNTDLDILINALCSADDPEALAAVREKAAAIRAAMGDEDLELSAQQHACLEQHPEWVGAVYAALFVDLDSSEDTTVAQAIRLVMEQEDAEIGDAFTALVEQLEDSGYDWMAPFRALPMPNDLEKQRLQEEGAVAAGDPNAIKLLDHGITPAIIYEATRGLHLLFERVERALATAGSEGPQEDWLRNKTALGKGISLIGPDGTAAHIPYPIVLAEIEGTPNILPGSAEALGAWIGEVVKWQPFLIGEYAYDWKASGFIRRQRRGDDIPRDLIAQWSHRAHAATRSQG